MMYTTVALFIIHYGKEVRYEQNKDVSETIFHTEIFRKISPFILCIKKKECLRKV